MSHEPHLRVSLHAAAALLVSLLQLLERLGHRLLGQDLVDGFRHPGGVFLVLHGGGQLQDLEVVFAAVAAATVRSFPLPSRQNYHLQRQFEAAI